MKLTTQKRLAAGILEVGENKVWFDSFRLDEIKQAITKQDIKDLIKDKAIRIRPGTKKPVKVKRARRGQGRIKISVVTRKRDYMNRIRKMRRYVKDEVEAGRMSKELAYQVRKFAKAGQFKNLRQAKEYVKLKK